MGKKRKASKKDDGPVGPRDVDPGDARLGHLTDFRDVADSEDEYFIRREEIALDGPASKRRKNAEIEDDFLEPSDDEVLAYSSDSEAGGERNGATLKGPSKGRQTDVHPTSDHEDGEQGGDEEGDAGWWGASKKDYYEADPIATEADALEEEKEARRIQQKRLAKMTEADFFDETEWLAATETTDDDGAVVEVLQDVEIPADASADEQLVILQARYPEFGLLVDEFQQLQALLPDVMQDASGQPAESVAVAKHYILGSLIATLATYLALLTSPARDAADGTRKPLSPTDLRNHEVMQILLQCRQAWRQIKDVRMLPGTDMSSSLPSSLENAVARSDAASGQVAVEDAPRNTNAKPGVDERKAAREKAKKRKAVKSNRRQKEVEQSLADLDALLVRPKGILKAKANPASSMKTGQGDAQSDFGEEETLDARTSAEKAARKKSLRFYTSQIVQKSNKRAEGAKNAGGDDDIPYRERLKDRQARLLAEAERRGKRDSKFGADLDSDDASEEEAATGSALRTQEDEYYDMIAQTADKRKHEKAQKYAAFAEAGKAGRVVEVEEVGQDGKRKISYAIRKNKGLTPRRKKEVKNPRVKKKEQFKKKQQKLGSIKPVYKGGEGPGGYGGELSGIKAGLVKSVKL